MLIERAKSPPSLAMMFPLLQLSSTLADRGLQKMQALAVERGHRRVVHLIGGDLEHLVFEIDGIAGGPGLETGLAVLRKTLSATRRSHMPGRGAHHRQRSHRSRVAAVESNFGSTRSRGLKFGVSELETFSESTRCRSWCHCILLRNADNTGRSLMDIAAALNASRHDALR